MKGKEIFKRIFFGKLATLRAEIEEGMAKYVSPVPSLVIPPIFRIKFYML